MKCKNLIYPHYQTLFISNFIKWLNSTMLYLYLFWVTTEQMVLWKNAICIL